MRTMHGSTAKRLQTICCPRLTPMEPAKAAFFARYGFRAENWEVLANALRKHGQTHPVVATVVSNFGSRYSIDGILETPVGRHPVVRTIWILSKGSTEPRLITAYPA